VRGDGDKYLDWANATTRRAQDRALAAFSTRVRAWLEKKEPLKVDNSSALNVLDTPKQLVALPNSNMAESGNNASMNSRLTNLARGLNVFSQEEAGRYSRGRELAKQCEQRG